MSISSFELDEAMCKNKKQGERLQEAIKFLNNLKEEMWAWNDNGELTSWIYQIEKFLGEINE